MDVSWRPKATGLRRCGSGTSPRSGTSRFRCSARLAWRVGFLTAFSPDGGLVAATDPGDDIGLWETQTRQRRQVLRRYNRSFDPRRPGGSCPTQSATAVISPGGGFLAALGQARDGRNRERPVPEAVGYRRPASASAPPGREDERHRAFPLAHRLRRRRRHAGVDLRRATATVGHGQPDADRPRRARARTRSSSLPPAAGCWRRRAASNCGSGTPSAARSRPPDRGSGRPATPSPASPSPRTAA